MIHLPAASTTHPGAGSCRALYLAAGICTSFRPLLLGLDVAPRNFRYPNDLWLAVVPGFLSPFRVSWVAAEVLFVVVENMDFSGSAFRFCCEAVGATTKDTSKSARRLVPRETTGPHQGS